MNRGWIGALVLGFFMFPRLVASAIADDTQSAKKEDRWKVWRPLVGIWEGTSQGNPGKGTVRLEVSFALNERYLRIAGTADYKNEKGGEHHEDFGYVSYDKSRKTNVFRQFHGEGFVNHYVLTSDQRSDKVIELTSESCENTPPGWRARERYIVKDDRLEHTFELAAPNKPFEVYARATLNRVKK